MTSKRIIGFSLAVILLLVFFYLYGGSTVPQGQQPLVRLNGSNIGGLKDAFNASSNSVRLLVLDSPTRTVCLQGASALEKLLTEHRNPRVRVFVIWEPVLPTDFGAPSTATLRRVSDLRASQYWDKEHVVSHLLGERDRKSVVWDFVAVYQPGKLWDQAPPDASYSGRRSSVLSVARAKPSRSYWSKHPPIIRSRELIALTM